MIVAALGMARETDYGPAIRDYELRLYRRDSGGGFRSQRVVFLEHVSLDGRPELLWSGDLDRDGQPDFLFDLTHHYNISHLALFLSSQANEDEIAGFVGELVTTGC